MPLPLIIDTDPGIDDALALLLAANSPELDVRGVSISYGNTTIENAYRNAVAIARLAGKRLRLAVGARRPLTRAFVGAAETHGESGLGYVDLPPAGVALDFTKPLERLLREQPEPVTLVTLGPLTSLALALKRDAGLVRATVSRHIAMVGTLDAPGNTTRYSEFNAWCDPEALAIVLGGLPSELVGLDVTRRFVLARADVDVLGAAEGRRARFLYDALRFYVEFHRATEGVDGCVVNDVLPIAVLLDPRVLDFESVAVTVDRSDGESRGRTRRAVEGDRDRAQVRFARSVRVDLAHAILAERVLRWAEEPEASTPVHT
ncbi:MAG TPA: nucleoside hydrolase [Gemmatimonadales bacterium]|nr:nucleoside hydrolase [Gemmatimonadales bacterium]